MYRHILLAWGTFAAAFLLLHRITGAQEPLSRGAALAGFGGFIGFLLVSLTASVLGMLAVRANRLQLAAGSSGQRGRYWPLVLAFLAALSFLLTFGVYFVLALLRH